MTPSSAAVIAFVNATVTTDDQVCREVRIDPQRVVINVSPVEAQCGPVLATVLGHHRECIHRIHSIGIVRVDNQFVVVLRTPRYVAGAFTPGVAEVGAAVDTAFFLVRFDDGVNDVCVGGCARQPDTTHVVF